MGYERTNNANMPAKNAAEQLATAINNQAGTYDLSKGNTVEFFKIPTSLAVVVYSNAAGGGAATDVYLFNNNGLTALVTDNGSGAASIVTTFGDGRSGKGYERLFAGANAGRGVLCKGFTIKAQNYTDNSLDSGFFTTANFAFLFETLKNAKVIPIELDLDEALRNSAFKDGILTIWYPFYFNSLAQINFELPTDTKVSLTIFTETSGFKG